MTKRERKRKKVLKKLCLSCEREVNINYFYMSSSRFSIDKKANICKRCVKKGFEEHDIPFLTEFLQHIDKPFLSPLWESSKHNIGLYMRYVQSLPQYASMGFTDSVFDDSNTITFKDKIKEQEVRRILGNLDEFIEKKVKEVLRMEGN